MASDLIGATDVLLFGIVATYLEVLHIEVVEVWSTSSRLACGTVAATLSCAIELPDRNECYHCHQDGIRP